MWNTDADLGPFRVVLLAWDVISEHLRGQSFIWPKEGMLIPLSIGLQASRSSAEQMRPEPQARAQLLWKMAFQPLKHSKRCFSKGTYSVILHFLAAKLLGLKFPCLCNTVRALPCYSTGTITPACGAGAPLGQPWNGCLSIVLVSSG